MRRLGISVVVHIISIFFLMVAFAAFDFDITTIPRWVIPVTFVFGGLTWDIINEVDEIT